MVIDFHQIYWHEDQKKEMFPFAKPYLNETLTPFFENKVIHDVVWTLLMEPKE